MEEEKEKIEDQELKKILEKIKEDDKKLDDLLKNYPKLNIIIN